MPPSFLVRKVFKGLFRLDRALLPRPPPKSHLACLAARRSNPADKIRVWWWKKTPMQRNSAVVDIPLTFGFVLLIGVEAKNGGMRNVIRKLMRMQWKLKWGTEMRE
ncbi:uncharacterized protein Bfra_007628 [Botrytis fragariae]|uniref:Uncharacterized protein n=1 Tax=Botrytis fragariae TaxID=1964551 RepID=A0A8H6APS0_9HELO|nr:uncharacterized protein Bfra_007628 [Botrytis fragariae]KAF5871115.1 hypothetical protein Bfra_007628 [Botrytis fragariae]